MRSFAVIGLGRFGFKLASKLSELKRDVLVIDSDENLVNAASDYVTHAVTADATNRDVLENLGIKDVDCAIVAVGTDLSASVLITMNLKALSVKKVICKANSETHREILEKLGADQVIIPEHVVADNLARNLVSSNLVDYIELSDDYSIAERDVPSIWLGKSIIELNIRAKYGINIIAIKRGDVTKVSPGANQTLGEGDRLVLIGTNEDLKKIEKIK